MENNNISIEQVFDTMDKNIVIKKKKSPLKGILLIVSGIVLIIIESQITTSTNSIIKPILIMLSLVFIIWGMLGTFIRKSFYVNVQTNQKINFKEIYFHENDGNQLISDIETRNLKDVKRLKNTVDSGIKLRLATTADNTFCYAQVLKYIPFEYVIKTNAIQLSVNQAKILLDSVE